jgi:hypothetical protein
MCPIWDSREAMDDLSIQELNGQVGILCMGENRHSASPHGNDVHLQRLKRSVRAAFKVASVVSAHPLDFLPTITPYKEKKGKKLILMF